MEVFDPFLRLISLKLCQYPVLLIEKGEKGVTGNQFLVTTFTLSSHLPLSRLIGRSLKQLWQILIGYSLILFSIYGEKVYRKHSTIHGLK